jgi:hypothetical protein
VFIPGATVVHDVVDITDVGDVGGLVDDGEVLPLIDEDGSQAAGTEVPALDKVVAAGADVIIVVCPGTDAHGVAKLCLWGQGCPADVAVAVPPGDPAWTPLRIRDPDPADFLNICPTAVVVDGPAVGLIGIKGPASIGVKPAALAIRGPAVVDIAGLPAVAVVADLPPVAIGLEIVIEEVQGDRDADVGGLTGWTAQQECREEAEQGFHGGRGSGVGSTGLLEHAATLDESHQEDDYGDNEQDVDESAHEVAGDEAEQPKDYQDNGDGLEHKGSGGV